MVARRTWHLRTALALIALLLLTGCASQASSPGRLIIDDETERLSQARVAEAAAPLLQRGATVAIFVVERGDNNGDDLTNRLAGVGLQGFLYSRIFPNAIAIYVSYEPRYSELRAGSNWSDDLPNDALSSIRADVLNPALRSGDLTDGMVETLKRFESALVWSGVVRRLPIVGFVLIIGAGVVMMVRNMLCGNLNSYHTSPWWSGSSDDSSSDSSSSSWSDSSSGGSSDGSSSSGGSW